MYKTLSFEEELSYSPKAFQGKSQSIMILKREKPSIDPDISVRLE